MTAAQGAKRAVLQHLAAGRPLASAGIAKYRIGRWTIHVRYCSGRDPMYPFNINPNTLSADFELWICGSHDRYYLVPTSLIDEMYRDPEAYVDARHPDIRAVSLDADHHRVTYARGGRYLDVRLHFCGQVP